MKIKITLIIITTAFILTVLLSFQNTSNITITVPSEDYYAFIESAVIEYNNSNKYKNDIVVEIDTLENTVSEIMYSSGEQTDMFFAPSYLIPSFVEDDIIAPIEYETANYSDVTNDTTSYEGQYYMLPFEYAMPVFVYDPTYYEEAPKTLEDIKPEDWATNFFSLINSELFIYQLWGNIYSSDQQSHTNKPEVVEFFTTIQSYYANDIGIWSDLVSGSSANNEIVDAYINDEIQAMIIPATKVSELIQNQATFEISEMVTVDESNVAHVYSNTYGLVINQNSEAKEECQDFITFLSTPNMVEYFIETTANLSPYIYQKNGNSTNFYAAEVEELYNNNTHYQTTWIVDDMKSFNATMHNILVMQGDVSESFEKYDQEHSKNAEDAEWEKLIKDN